MAAVIGFLHSAISSLSFFDMYDPTKIPKITMLSIQSWLPKSWPAIFFEPSNVVWMMTSPIVSGQGPRACTTLHHNMLQSIALTSGTHALQKNMIFRHTLVQNEVFKGQKNIETAQNRGFKKLFQASFQLWRSFVLHRCLTNKIWGINVKSTR